MDALHMSLLLDYYGGLLTQRQRDCFDMRYNQDLSLGEIGEMLGVSRQAVCDNLARSEALLRKMEENIGCVSRGLENRKQIERILLAVRKLEQSDNQEVSRLAREIAGAAQSLKE